MAMTYRITFVCTGNICRSPMAEAVLRRILDLNSGPRPASGSGDVVVDSFGTTGWHVGEPADPRAVAALRRRGYDISHRARKWRPELFAARDLVVALDSGHLADLRAGAPDPAAAGRVWLLRSFDPATRGSGGSELDVPDPYHGGAVVFDRALDLIERACRGLADRVRGVAAPT
ncbi:MAG TPA: low molecular weight protein-tyrosine-phosphatase [Mycobacteriales bacterium]|nr:low molecular weight protein-tyrosine-phosphatase [Mycobacteriales bacterium]